MPRSPNPLSGDVTYVLLFHPHSSTILLDFDRDALVLCNQLKSFPEARFNAFVDDSQHIPIALGCLGLALVATCPRGDHM